MIKRMKNQPQKTTPSKNKRRWKSKKKIKRLPSSYSNKLFVSNEFSSSQPVSRVPSESGSNESRSARRSTRNSTRIALKKSEGSDPPAQNTPTVPKDTATSKITESLTKARLAPEAPIDVDNYKKWNPEIYEDFLDEDKKKALREQLNKYPKLKCLKNFQRTSYVRQMKSCFTESICFRQIDDPDTPRKVLDMPKSAKDYLMMIPQKDLLQLVLLTRDIKQPGERDGDFEIILERIREQIVEVTDNFPKYELGKEEDFAQIEGLLIMLITMLKSQIKSRKESVHYELHRFTLFLAHLISKTQIPDKKNAGPNSAIVFCK
jgi:hypothetical protein